MVAYLGHLDYILKRMTALVWAFNAPAHSQYIGKNEITNTSEIMD